MCKSENWMCISAGEICLSRIEEDLSEDLSMYVIFEWLWLYWEYKSNIL